VRHAPIIFAQVAAALALIAPATAGEPVSRPDLSGIRLGLPPTAETGKPPTIPPGAVAPRGSDGCLPALPCGTRLLGAVRKDGAVELQVPALRW
jgi:hypothetical protein